MDTLAYVLANPPGGGLEASRTYPGVLHTSRVPSTVALTTSSSSVDDDVQLALVTAPAIPGISAVLTAFVEGESCCVHVRVRQFRVAGSVARCEKNSALTDPPPSLSISSPGSELVSVREAPVGTFQTLLSDGNPASVAAVASLVIQAVDALASMQSCGLVALALPLSACGVHVAPSGGWFFALGALRYALATAPGRSGGTAHSAAGVLAASVDSIMRSLSALQSDESAALPLVGRLDPLAAVAPELRAAMWAAAGGGGGTAGADLVDVSAQNAHVAGCLIICVAGFVAKTDAALGSTLALVGNSLAAAAPGERLGVADAAATMRQMFHPSGIVTPPPAPPTFRLLAAWAHANGLAIASGGGSGAALRRGALVFIPIWPSQTLRTVGAAVLAAAGLSGAAENNAVLVLLPDGSAHHVGPGQTAADVAHILWRRGALVAVCGSAAMAAAAVAAPHPAHATVQSHLSAPVQAQGADHFSFSSLGLGGGVSGGSIVASSHAAPQSTSVSAGPRGGAAGGGVFLDAGSTAFDGTAPGDGSSFLFGGASGGDGGASSAGDASGALFGSLFGLAPTHAVDASVGAGDGPRGSALLRSDTSEDAESLGLGLPLGRGEALGEPRAQAAATPLGTAVKNGDRDDPRARSARQPAPKMTAPATDADQAQTAAVAPRGGAPASDATLPQTARTPLPTATQKGGNGWVTAVGGGGGGGGSGGTARVGGSPTAAPLAASVPVGQAITGVTPPLGGPSGAAGAVLRPPPPAATANTSSVPPKAPASLLTAFPRVPPAAVTANVAAGAAQLAGTGVAVVRPGAGGPALTAEMEKSLTAFAADVAARLRPFGVALALPPAAPKPFFDYRKGLPASSIPAAARSANKVNELRDWLRELQDRTHLRQEAQLRALGALGYPELVAAAVQAGAVGCKDSIVASYALQSVGNLAMETSLRAHFADLGAIELVIDTMRAHGSSAAPAGAALAGGGGGGRVQKDAIVALRHLAYENDASKKRVLDAGGVEAVVSAMTAFGDNPHVQRQAAGAIALLAVHSALGDAARARVLGCGGLTAVVAAIRRWPEEKDLVSAGIKALSALVALTEARTAARAAGVLELIDAVAKKEKISIASGGAGGGELGELMRAMVRRLEKGAGGEGAPVSGGAAK